MMPGRRSRCLRSVGTGWHDRRRTWQDDVIRDYEVASGLDLPTWLALMRERDGLVPDGEPESEVDDIGRTVLRFEMVPAEQDD